MCVEHLKLKELDWSSTSYHNSSQLLRAIASTNMSSLRTPDVQDAYGQELFEDQCYQVKRGDSTHETRSTPYPPTRNHTFASSRGPLYCSEHSNDESLLALPTSCEETVYEDSQDGTDAATIPLGLSTPLHHYKRLDQSVPPGELVGTLICRVVQTSERDRVNHEKDMTMTQFSLSCNEAPPTQGFGQLHIYEAETERTSIQVANRPYQARLLSVLTLSPEAAWQFSRFDKLSVPAKIFATRFPERCTDWFESQTSLPVSSHDTAHYKEQAWLVRRDDIGQIRWIDESNRGPDVVSSPLDPSPRGSQDTWLLITTDRYGSFDAHDIRKLWNG